MSSQDNQFQRGGTQRPHGDTHGAPYTAKHPVPTVQDYREHRAALSLKEPQQSSNGKVISDEDRTSQPETYPVANRNLLGGEREVAQRQSNQGGDNQDDGQSAGRKTNEGGKEAEARRSYSGASVSGPERGDKKGNMKGTKGHGPGRQVTDPVTHLPITIHDMTTEDLQAAPENEPSAGSTAESSTGLSGATKSRTQLDNEEKQMGRGHQSMREMVPSTLGGDMQTTLVELHKKAAVVGLFAVAGTTIIGVGIFSQLPGRWTWLTAPIVISITAASAYFLTAQASGWVENKVKALLDDETWNSARKEENRVFEHEAEIPESVGWLNGLLSSVWPLINPDLFTSLADTLEDVMQASLPKVIRMVSVEDLGQGSEAIRILGVKWLPTGAAAQSIDTDGNLRDAEDHANNSLEGTANHKDDDHDKKGPSDDGDGQVALTEDDMGAEEGDFVNLEVAFAYRARATGTSVRTKSRNAHLYLKFFLPGGVVVPVWVELRGVIGIMRLRLQLTPDPPFFSLCTLTFLGQPQIDMSCVPLSKHSPNIMDVPFISRFVQSSVDAALAEYVAPRSLALDLKEMLMGDGSKKDTEALGVILVYIKHARGFKEGDGGIGPMQGSSDTFVTVTWGKFGKPLTSTRIILESQEPNWNEWASILVTPEELNAEETLRLQLWDSDKYTADDDLGRVEVPVKDLIRCPETRNHHCDREDGLQGDDPDEKMPGTLTWSVGYFAKTRIQQDQLDSQDVHPNIRSTDQLESWASETAASKLRESASSQDGSDERRQQTAVDFKEKEDQMVTRTPPPRDFPSGILSVQIHNITGLEISKPNKRSGGADGGQEDETEQGHELPDSYCTIILNHRKVYRTRTKPKDAKPFFNAGTERFVPDWRTGEIIISVRDRRDHENNPLLGVVYLPLRRVFEERSQVMETFPLAGGVGYGRVRVSLAWRSVECRLPRELMGWDYGTLEVKPIIRSQGITDEKIKKCGIHLRTPIARAKMRPSPGEDSWHPKKTQESVFLAVAKRYRAPLVLEFRQSSMTQDRTSALAVLWLSEVPDEEEKQVNLKIWKGDKNRLARAQNSADYEGFDEAEKPLGEVKVTLKFWRGLSGYHKGYASKPRNEHIRDVMEALDTVNGEDLAAGDESKENASFNDSNSESDSESSSCEKTSNSTSAKEKRKMLRRKGTESSSSSDNDPTDLPNRLKERVLDGGGGGADDGRRGARAQIRDYRANRRQLHRKHRGVMQWKATRTLDWVAGKVKRGKGRVGEKVGHGEKGGGIETEV